MMAKALRNHGQSSDLLRQGERRRTAFNSIQFNGHRSSHVGCLLLLHLLLFAGASTDDQSRLCPNLKLNPSGGGGAEMPAMGFGTCCRKSAKGQALQQSLALYFAAGGRLVDTADMYRNHKDIKVALQELFEGGRVMRRDVWVTTKVNTKKTTGGFVGVQRTVERYLDELGLDYLDLVIFHHPACNNPTKDGLHVCLRDGWRGLNELQKLGKVKAIGTSNFNQEQLEALMEPMEDGSVVVPAVNQLEFHPFVDTAVKQLVEWMHTHGIHATAYGSLGSSRFSGHVPDAVVKAGTAHGGAKAQQVLLRWGIDRGVAVIPGATSKEHIEENLAICKEESGFKLGAQEEADISNARMPEGWRLWNNLT
jgi:diketogulonate reductase-like aldo/keto reductase